MSRIFTEGLASLLTNELIEMLIIVINVVGAGVHKLTLLASCSKHCAFIARVSFLSDQIEF